MLLLPGLYEFSSENTDSYPIGGGLKRSFDLLVAATSLFLTAPLICVTYILIKLSSPGPAFYIHRRIGLNGREFGCIKFRTMYCDSDARLVDLLQRDPEAAREFAAKAKLARDPRIIAGVGALLRKTSLDEVPQFLNVLRGEMSVIGPRPVTAEELTRHYGPRARDVLRARPGISGLWQVSGRSDLSYDERVRLDLRYVRDWRFMGDLVILLRTFGVVLRGRGAC